MERTKILKHSANEVKEQWEREIEARHPVISHAPKESWPFIVRFNGWLPLPPQEESYGD